MSLQACMHPCMNAATMKIYPCVVHEITRKAAAMFRPMTRSRPRLLKQPSHRINKKSTLIFITARAWKFIHSFILNRQMMRSKHQLCEYSQKPRSQSHHPRGSPASCWRIFWWVWAWAPTRCRSWRSNTETNFVLVTISIRIIKY